jgi:ABC-type amino acid transport substrate-binding protein
MEGIMRRAASAFLAFLALVLPSFCASAQAPESRLGAIRSTDIVRIAYRTDSRPFSFLDGRGQPTGYTIDLCKLIVSSLEQQLGKRLTVEWVPVETRTRFMVVANGTADMECGSSTVTLTRMKEVDFSSIIFVESTGVLVRANAGIYSFNGMAGKRIAVITGTTNERAIAEETKRRQLSVAMIPVKDRDSGISALKNAEVDGFASDKLLLLGAMADGAQGLTMLFDDLSFEPYAIVLPRGDWEFRLAVNRALAQIYGRGDNLKIFDTWFKGMGLKVGLLLGAAFALGNLPD